MKCEFCEEFTASIKIYINGGFLWLCSRCYIHGNMTLGADSKTRGVI